MAKDYYLILGVSRDANQEEIKSAYRRAVKDHHPDVSKSPDKEKFIEIQEAYDVLKDPEKKRAYDESLKKAEGKFSPAYTRDPTSIRTGPFDLISSFFDELFNDIDPIFSASRKRLLRRTLTAEIVLTPEEAEKGGYLPLTIPADQTCSVCRGEGRLLFSRCPQCLGQGRIFKEIDIRIRIPPSVTHGTLMEIDLHEAGIENARLRLHITIARDRSL